MHHLWAPRRAIVSLLVASLGFGTVLAAGSAAPIEEGTRSTWSVAQPLAGDDATFHFAIFDGEALVAGPLASARLSRAPPSWEFDTNGQPVLANVVERARGSYVAAGTNSLSYEPDDATTRLPWGWYEPRRVAEDSAGHHLWSSLFEEDSEATPNSVLGVIPSTTSFEASAQGRMFLVPENHMLGDCLFETVGGRVEAGASVHLRGCDLHMPWVDEAHPEYTTGKAMHARGMVNGGLYAVGVPWSVVGAVDTAWGEGFLLRLAGPPSMTMRAELAFVPTIPYPVWASLVDLQSGREAIHFLSQFERGTPMETTSHAPSPLAPLAWQPALPWGLDDRGIDLPLTPSEAWAIALEPRDGQPSALASFLAAHPTAFVERATSEATVIKDDLGQTHDAYQWTFQLRDGSSRLGIQVAQGAPPPAGLGMLTPTMQEVQTVEPRIPSVDLPDVPTSLPSMTSVAKQFQALTGQTGTPQKWTLEPSCNGWIPSSCPAEEAGLAVSVRLQTNEASRDIDPEELTIAERNSVTLDGLNWRPNGELRSQTQISTTFERSAAPPPPPAEEPVTQVAMIPAAPTLGVVAVAAGMAAIFVAVAYYFWPLAKTGMAGLFSRIHGPQALEHPKRQALFDAVQAKPGIHFQELVRLQSGGKGTTDHHLRKLVQAGQLARRDAGGYACYFPKGTDRRVMAAAPALRSDTARRIVEAVGKQPGITGGALADAAGVNRGTVAHHVKRLATAGLIESKRDGRSIRYWATEIARAR